MKHTLLVAQNHFRSFYFNQSFQSVVTDDNTTIQIVQVGCCKTAAIERNQRTQLRRNHRDNLQNHPLRTVLALRCAERLNNLQTFQGLSLTLLRCLGIGLVAQIVRKVIEIQVGKQVINGLCTHLGDELVRVCILKMLIFFRKFLHQIDILLFRQQIQIVYTKFCRSTSTNNDIALVVNHHIKFFSRQAKQITYFVRQRFEVPDVGNRHNQLDVSHTLAAHFLLSNLDTATVADDAFISDTLVLTAVALVIFNGAEDAFAEQTVAFWFVSTVVDCLGF